MMNNLDSILIKYDTDLCREDEDISTFLSSQYNEFLADIESSTGQDFSDVRSVCDTIVKVLDDYRTGKTVKAFDDAYSLFNEIERYLVFSEIYQKTMPGYYRIREGRFEKKEKTELFHIPYKKQNLIGAHRYSVAGQPCLYASSSIRQAWIECGMPREFSYAQLKIEEQPDTKVALRLVDFSQDIKTIIRLRDFRNKRDSVDQLIKNYIYSYPLRVACSLIVKNKNDKFIAEYIVPQLLMQWIRDTKKFDGVKYKPTVNNYLRIGSEVFNIALITSEYREDGLDKRLTEIITVSNVEKVSLQKTFEDYQENVNKVEKTVLSLRSKINKLSRKEPDLNDIANLCDVFVLLFKTVQQGNYSDKDTELIFHFIDIINSYRKFIHRKKKAISDEMRQKKHKDHELDLIFEDLDEMYECLDDVLEDDGLFFNHIKKTMKSFTNI